VASDLASFIPEIAAVAASLALLGGYAARLAAHLRRDPLYSIQAYHQHVRSRWARQVLGDPSQALLGVQTLRNSTMGATFLASTVVLLLMGALNLVGEPDAFGRLWPGLDTRIASHPALWNLKILALVVDLFVAFFAFAMSVRLLSHISYQLALSPDDAPRGVTAERVSGMLNRAGRLFSVGLRACYLGMPLVFWLFGPTFLVLATGVLVAVMSRLDRNAVPGEAG
jgi:uncharacterized membrane protein